jgi:hypothetical protein
MAALEGLPTAAYYKQLVLYALFSLLYFEKENKLSWLSTKCMLWQYWLLETLFYC